MLSRSEAPSLMEANCSPVSIFNLASQMDLSN
jgi:hypothetical protein